MARREFTFDKGLVTDAIGVEGALLELTDGWIARRGEIRKRGGKSTWADNSGTVSVGYEICAGGVWAEALVGTAGFSTYHGAILLQHYNSKSTAPKFAYAYGTSSYATWSEMGGTATRRDAAGTISAGAFGQPVVHDGEVLIPSGGAQTPAGNVFKWSGAPANADYTTGTVSTAVATATVTGVGTAFGANVSAGQYIQLASGVTRWMRIKSVDSDTQLTLAGNTGALTSGVAYRITSFAPLTQGNITWGAGGSADPSYGVIAGSVASHAGRAFFGNTTENGIRHPSRVRWSGLAAETSGSYVGAECIASAAYLDVSPGTGGMIVGLASFNGSLIVMKEGAAFVLRGDVATDATDLGARTEVLSRSGCFGKMAMAVSREGVVWANADGLYITDGTGVRSLTDGVISQLWRETVGATGNVFPSDVFVSAANDRIVVQASPHTFVYSLSQQVWMRQTAPSCGTIVQVSDREAGVHAQLSGGRGEADRLVYGWHEDFSTTYKNDGNGTSSPRLKITTHPMPLGEGVVGQGRVNTVFVNGYVTDGGVENPDLQAKLLYGRKGFETGAGAATTLTPTVDEGSEDVTTRMTVDSAPAKSAVRLQVQQTAAASDARIYGAAIDYEPVNTIT